MYILSIDPGSENSGVAYYNAEDHVVLWSDDKENRQLLSMIRVWADGNWRNFELVMAIEGLENQGHFVGRSTFDTAEWIGRFREAWEVAGRKSFRISRRDVKTVMCGGSTYRGPDTGAQKTVNDTVVSRAVRARFPATGGGQDAREGHEGPAWPLVRRQRLAPIFSNRYRPNLGGNT